MATNGNVAVEAARINAEELKERLGLGEPVTLLDVRSDPAWAESQEMIKAARRVNPNRFQVDPGWPKERLTVTYCT
jgi:hypothetical protein